MKSENVEKSHTKVSQAKFHAWIALDLGDWQSEWLLGRIGSNQTIEIL